ncbi:MAG: glycosyltransferase family 2 protein, partial [Minisyncoccia bacterium]
MTAPKITLIISAYNEEKYIGECLDYVLRNSRGQFLEILVIDNASTDRTAEIAGQRPGVRVVREDTRGVTRARQRGYREARGEILAFIDADTRHPEGWYEKIVEEFSNDSELACLSGPYLYYDFPFWLRSLATFFWRAIAYPVSRISGYMAIAGNMVLTKEALDKMGGFDTSIEFYGDDTDTVRRAKAFGNVKFSLSFVMPTSGRRFF